MKSSLSEDHVNQAVRLAIRKLKRLGWTVDKSTKKITKQYTLNIFGINVRGEGSHHPNMMAVLLRRLYSRNWTSLFFPTVGWKQLSSVSHPHYSAQHLCHSVQISASTIKMMRQDSKTAATILANAINDAPEIINNYGVVSPWRYCDTCHILFIKRAGRTHRCDRNRTSSKRFGDIALIGCGVVGSWLVPVLSRACRQLYVFDNDRVTMNHAGRWSNIDIEDYLRNRPIMKVDAVAEKLFSGSTILIPENINHAFRNTSLPLPQMLVLATDTASSRLTAAEKLARAGRTIIVDFRVTRDELVVWKVLRGGNYSTWKESLEGYDDTVHRCGDRDDVPQVAGTQAAAVMSYLLTKLRWSDLDERPTVIRLNDPYNLIDDDESESDRVNERRLPDDASTPSETQTRPDPQEREILVSALPETRD